MAGQESLDPHLELHGNEGRKLPGDTAGHYLQHLP